MDGDGKRDPPGSGTAWREVCPVATVLVCDDSATVRENLHRVLASVPGITRIVDASSGE